MNNQYNRRNSDSDDDGSEQEQQPQRQQMPQPKTGFQKRREEMLDSVKRDDDKIKKHHSEIREKLLACQPKGNLQLGGSAPVPIEAAGAAAILHIENQMKMRREENRKKEEEAKLRDEQKIREHKMKMRATTIKNEALKTERDILLDGARRNKFNPDLMRAMAEVKRFLTVGFPVDIMEKYLIQTKYDVNCSVDMMLDYLEKDQKKKTSLRNAMPLLMSLLGHQSYGVPREFIEHLLESANYDAHKAFALVRRSIASGEVDQYKLDKRQQEELRDETLDAMDVDEDVSRYDNHNNQPEPPAVSAPPPPQSTRDIMREQEFEYALSEKRDMARDRIMQKQREEQAAKQRQEAELQQQEEQRRLAEQAAEEKRKLNPDDLRAKRLAYLQQQQPQTKVN